MSANILEKRKHILLNALAALIPIFLLGLLEMGLRYAGAYGDQRSVFVEMDGRPDYLGVNPEFAARYFNGFVPSVAYNPFKAQKDDDTFRVVALGGSSTAGFPYQFYYGFPEAIAKRLSTRAAGQQIEIINLGMTAVNSFTIWDIREDVLDIDPDAIVIYAGHNEYYGAFGAGSTLYSLGNLIWLKRTVLRLKKWVLFLMMEDLLTSRPDPNARPNSADDRTLMSRVVRDASIDLGDKTYLDGLRQFEANMSDVVLGATARGIPVFVGTLVSNLSGQRPLGDNNEAKSVYEEGTQAIASNPHAADSLFQLARDLDNIRFRAPSEINRIIERIAQNGGATLVDLRPVFARASEQGIPGYDLFVDHLHPTVEGYDLMGEAFSQALYETPGLLDNRGTWQPDVYLDPFAASQSALLIERLLSDYPFVSDKSPEEISRQSDALVRKYLTSGKFADSLAAVSVSSGVTIQEVLYKGLQSAKAHADTASVLGYYRALFYWQPFNLAFRQEGVSYALDKARFDSLTLPLAALGARSGRDVFFWNALGAILLRSSDLSGANVAMQEAERIDPQSPTLLFNRARYFVVTGDTTSARQYFTRFQETQK